MIGVKMAVYVFINRHFYSKSAISYFVFTPSIPSRSAGPASIFSSKFISVQIFFAKTARARRSDFWRGDGLVWDLLRGGGWRCWSRAVSPAVVGGLVQGGDQVFDQGVE